MNNNNRASVLGDVVPIPGFERKTNRVCGWHQVLAEHDGIKNRTFEIVSILVSLNNYRQLPTQSPAGFSQYLVR